MLDIGATECQRHDQPPRLVRRQGVLSIAKLAGSDQRYYLDQAQRRVDHTESVSTGAEDYYLSGPEATGRWSGGGAPLLGLKGKVSESALRAVLSKNSPDGTPLPGSVQKARVPGFDLMFSVPKSASILFGIGDGETQRAILDAQQAAVDSAVQYLERVACRTRRGAGGYEVVPGDGFVGAAFRHRTSRAGDPQVHTHLLIANATRTDDENWGALDARAIYAEARTAGFIHEAVFRRELRQRLGVDWTRTRNGIAEVDGVSADAIRAFSQRKAQIDEQVAAWGTDSAAARQTAALVTRRRKDFDVTPDQLAPEWRARAELFGLDGDRVRQITRRRREISPLQVDELFSHLLSPEGLTALRSSFDRRDVVRAIAAAVPAGLTLAEIEELTARFLEHGDVVVLDAPGGGLRKEDLIRRRDGRLVTAVADSPMYSTRELLGLEAHIVEAATAGVGDQVGVAAPEAIAGTLTRRDTIGDDQRVMVERLCGEGSRVQVVVGPPGTGKTYALDAAREAWERSGLTVRGAAVARRAALELTSSAGIDATSVASLLLDLRRSPGEVLDDRTVLVIDEAAMLGTRPLHELVEHVHAAEAKLVLVGDHAQLPEIEAGGAFRALAERTPAIQLTTNRRQRHADDRELLTRWRDGDLREALVLAVGHGSLVLDGTAEETYRRITRDFTKSLLAGDDAILLAPRRVEVGHLNHLVRADLRKRGMLGGEEMELHGLAFAVGDRIVCRSNAPSLGVENGTRGTLVAFDRSAAAMTIQLLDGSLRHLPSSYLLLPTRRRTSPLEHGYALTAHLAQGLTVDRAFVLGSETVFREWGYVAWSRARESTRFYAVAPDVYEEHHTAAPPDVEPFEEVLRRLGRSQAQHIASDAVADRRAGAARHGDVGYLVEAIGPRPDTFRRRRRWDRCARRIERYRRAHSIVEETSPLGGAPIDRGAHRGWVQATRQIQRTRLDLGLPIERENPGLGIDL
jgi:conjugative relaxase-like TrwC/TraI family protein